MAQVSLVVPIYNVDAYLERCLESIRHQTFKDIEVLCINDGSTDTSQSIIDQFVKKDERFKSFIKPNGGLSDARNYGLQRVTSAVVMFPDSDDFCEPSMVEKAYTRMIKDQLDCVVFDYAQYFDAHQTKEVIHLPFDDNTIYAFDTHPELIAYMNNAAWNKLYKVSIFRDEHIEYPLGYRHQDLGTTLRYLYFCDRIGYIHEPLYNYLADRLNNLTQMVDQKIRHIIDMNQINIHFFKEKDIFNRYYEELKYVSAINLMTSLRKLPRLSDKEFVFEFIDQSFDFMEHHFPGYPKCVYPLNKEPHAFIYTHRNLLKWYYRYTQLRRSQ